MVRRKTVSFLARKPVKQKVCFKTKGGKKICFKAKVPKKVRVKFLARK